MSVPLTLLDFFALGKRAVQLFPLEQDRPCLQPKTWRVLQKERGSELNTLNLGAVPTDKDKPFFWSKNWHVNKYTPNKIEFDYPIVTAYEIYNNKDTPFDSSGVREYVVELAVLDVYKEADCIAGRAACSGRPINQIFLDTEVILDSLFQYFGKLVLAQTSEDVVPKVYLLPWLQQRTETDKGFLYEVKKDIGADIAQANKQVRFSRVERHAQNIYGTKAQLTLKVTNCPVVQYNPALPDFGVSGYELGCKNC